MNSTLGRIGLLAILIASTCTTNAANLVLNPSFEDNQASFTVFPGYISGNTTISNWTANDATRVGINGNAGSGNPFANNGTKPDGVAVAFLQSSGVVSTLSQSVSGLSIGQTYQVTARVNSRNPSGTAAVASVTMGSDTLLSNQTINSVGGTNPYRYLSFLHTAGATTESLTFQNSAAGDQTLLLDAVSVDPVYTTGWSKAAWNDNATSGISTSNPYSHAYNFGAATNPLINGVTFTGVGGGAPAVAGRFAMSANYNSAFANDANNVVDAGGSRTLANDFVYNGNPGSLTISGLHPYQTYRATLYGVGFDTGVGRAATFSVGNDRLTVDENGFGNNNGTRISYEYTTGLNGSVTIDIAPLGGNSFHLYGFANEVLSAQPITGLFNTGVDNSNALLGNNVNDPHWELLSPNPAGSVTDWTLPADGFPIPPWLANGPNSRWIAPATDNDGNGGGGNYTYRTTFNAIGSGQFGVRIKGQAASDNSPLTIQLNGVTVATLPSIGLSSFSSFDFTGLAVGGLNNLDFIVNNAAAGPTGLRVEFTSAVIEVPEPSSIILSFVGLAGLISVRRRMRSV